MTSKCIIYSYSWFNFIFLEPVSVRRVLDAVSHSLPFNSVVLYCDSAWWSSYNYLTGRMLDNNLFYMEVVVFSPKPQVKLVVHLLEALLSATI